MKGFNFEKDLAHQKQAVENTLAVFNTLQLKAATGAHKNHINPAFVWKNMIAYKENIKKLQAEQQISESFTNSHILDIMMETGTGKTYTYTKTIFELNKKYGIFKFIIVVPTLSIKAGTINFLKSDSCREHFKSQYDKTLHLHIVESQKSNKSKKSHFPPAIANFVKADSFEKNQIQVLLINAGMLNSETLQKSFDISLFDTYTVPFDALAATQSFMIIDEPHKFGQNNKTWENIEKIKPQFILRYGATFPEKAIKQKNLFTNKNEVAYTKDYHNLIYQLSAVDAFNQNLVKGIIGHLTEHEGGKNAVVRFLDSDGTEASFELVENNKRKTVRLSKKESLEKIHSQMVGLYLENLNKSTAILSNGLEMKKGDKINPYSYATTLQEMMLAKAIKNHFEIEKKLLTRQVKIKPLTLFFIDNIEAYRGKAGSKTDEGYLRQFVESCIKAEVEALLEVEENAFYKAYLAKTLTDLSGTHGGYFSKDNSEKDEATEKEINEILHDKQALLDLENPRRFIFSKWTLREGWDNPNVFQICKLRSSGSEISKLQEVGRGLRLPVNEYGNRVKEEQFHLHYFVDFTESDFIDKLVGEINSKSGAISMVETQTNVTPLIPKILERYSDQFSDTNALLKYLDKHNVVNRSNDFEEGGFDFIKENFPAIFEGVNPTKVRKATDPKPKISVRTSKYGELKALWEKLNEKVVLEYKFENEAHFQSFLTDFLKTQADNLMSDDIEERVAQIEIKDNKAVAQESESIYNRQTVSLSLLKYSSFLKELSKLLNINLKTLHQSLVASQIELNSYLNPSTLRTLKQNFDTYLMTQAFDKYSIAYKKVSNQIHPTKFTNAKGEVLTEISSADVGVNLSTEAVAKAYFFDELYYDSELEKQNIKTEIAEVVVFTKIPKNSIKIPVAGGKSYSPDFAYVVKFKDGSEKLNLIIETKNVGSQDELRQEEKLKIKHAEKFFEGRVKIEFRTQLRHDKMAHFIKSIVTGL
ncbi:type III restriction-modification system endonuclease [Hugenholtzia roseola]|uniref:type III restriction-modification system endonuclease n=1 Tax=Hugenholtzia roseola TaxID=1002 RepID=UPI0003FDCEE4|nr:type III restriction-modification system endonuclease [Hugenholtzia roseola]